MSEERRGNLKLFDFLKQAVTEHLFPTVLIVLDFAAAVVYFRHSDYKRAVYWLAAAVLNICVTF